MNRSRSIALISVVDAADAADTIANALRTRAAGAKFVRAILEHLEPVKVVSLFDEPDDAA